MNPIRTAHLELKIAPFSLGKSGLKVSKVILGAMSYGDPEWQGWILKEDESLPLLEHAYKVGINTWDTVCLSLSLRTLSSLFDLKTFTARHFPILTVLILRTPASLSIFNVDLDVNFQADVYSHGRSEEIIGKALLKYNIPRERVVILSKCYFGVTSENMGSKISAVSVNDGEMVNRIGLSRKHIFDAVDASVKRLGTYIDVLQIHRLDRNTPREEIMKALNDVVESGKVRYIGASSMAAWEFQSLQNIADRKGWHKFISMQNYYNLLYREEENEMFPYCNDTGVGLIPWSPVARGALTRPWGDRSTQREKTDNALHNMIRKKETEVDKAIVDRLEEVSKKMGKSMAQVAIAWCLSKKDVMPIVGLGKKERMYVPEGSVQWDQGKLMLTEIPGTRPSKPARSS